MSDILIRKKNIILDATVFSTFQACARLTDFRFNQDLTSVGGKSVSLEMGSIVHIILESYNKRYHELNRPDNIAEAYAAGRRYVEESGEVQNSSPEDIETAFWTMDQYFEYYKNDAWVPVEVEHVKQALIYEDDEIRIIWKAKLDLTVDTNQGIYPVDHKTMKQRRDTLSLNNQFMGQCVLVGTRGVIINKIGFQKTVKPSEKFTRPLISYSLDQLTEWSQITVPFYAKLMASYGEAEYWPPNFTHCENKYGFCQFKEVCEQNPNMREETMRLNFIKGKKWDVTNVEE